MKDTIYRQAAIEAFADYIHNVDKVYSTGKLSTDDCKDAAKSVLDDLPSAQPEQRWISVTERLPKEYGEYICTMENGQVQECGFVPENQRGLVDGWSTCEADGHKFLGYADVLAWMPLPEPYKGEQS